MGSKPTVPVTLFVEFDEKMGFHEVDSHESLCSLMVMAADPGC